MTRRLLFVVAIALLSWTATPRAQMPDPSQMNGLSMPTPSDVERYARNHYGAVFIRLDDDCDAASAA